ncbi:HAMP domain-containing sensor histidine kinase [Paenibacillus sp. FSL M8-0334]|uniref:sensor histidine kinase n=1 Tax=Paenibacillus sp. FSL M8-0334 TaxID=2921623 RepID=UPI0030FA2E7E
MNSMVKMAFRFLRLTLLFVTALVISFIICAVGLLYIQEHLDWLNPVSPRTLLLSLGFILTIAFVCAYGWLVGKPLIYFIRWINRLSKGNYTEPGEHYRIKHYRKKHDHKEHDKEHDDLTEKPVYRYPFVLYKELLEQMSRLTEQLYKSEAERLNLEAKKQEWIASISHDLKTPLSYIEGYAHMLTAAEYHWSDEEKLDFSRQISSKTAEMKQLIQELNQTSRWQVQQERGETDSLQEAKKRTPGAASSVNFPMNLQEDNIVDFVRDTVIDIANHPMAEHTLFTFTASEPVHMMEFDSKLFGRAVQNVLMNAAIHNPPGTQVTCDLGFRENSCLLVVEDDGVGIDEQALKRALYHSGKGIAIARAFIEAHSGHMNIVKSDGGGTRVEITLPMLDCVVELM